jgi:hypothetical protein
MRLKSAMLERLCRYISRPAISAQRLSLTPSGNDHYQLKTPYRDGTARGITINRIRTKLEGDIDPQGFLTLDPDEPPCDGAIRIRMDIEADCSDEELEGLLNFARPHEPVCDTICRPVPVTLVRVRQ